MYGELYDIIEILHEPCAMLAATCLSDNFDLGLTFVASFSGHSSVQIDNLCMTFALSKTLLLGGS